MLLVEGDEIAVLQVRVIFDLVDGRHDLCCGEDGFQVGLQEVGDADGFRAAGSVDGFHVCPFLLQVLSCVGEEGGVNQV